MIPVFEHQYHDNSNLRKAWEKYYSRFGIGEPKMQSKVRMRVNKGKMPVI